MKMRQPLPGFSALFIRDWDIQMGFGPAEGGKQLGELQGGHSLLIQSLPETPFLCGRSLPCTDCGLAKPQSSALAPLPLGTLLWCSLPMRTVSWQSLPMGLALWQSLPMGTVPWHLLSHLFVSLGGWPLCAGMPRSSRGIEDRPGVGSGGVGEFGSESTQDLGVICTEFLSSEGSPTC